MKIRVSVLLLSGEEVPGEAVEVDDVGYQNLKSVLESSLEDKYTVFTTDPAKFMGETHEHILRLQHVSGFRITHL